MKYEILQEVLCYSKLLSANYSVFNMIYVMCFTIQVN